MPLKIAFLTSTFPQMEFESARFAEQLVQSLAGLTHDVHVVTTASEEIVNTYPRATVHKIIQKWGLTDMPRLFFLLNQLRPDIIHLHHPSELCDSPLKLLPYALIEMNKTMGQSRIITTLHDFKKRSWITKKLYLSLVAGSSLVTVPNEAEKNAIAKILPEAEKKIEVVDLVKKFAEHQLDSAANDISRLYSKLL